MKAKKTSSPSLKVYVDKLLEEKNFPESLPHKERAKIKEDVLVLVEKHIKLRTLNSLSDEDLKTFAEMINDDKSEEDLQEFISEKIPHQTLVVAQALLDFRTNYLGLNLS